MIECTKLFSSQIPETASLLSSRNYRKLDDATSGLYEMFQFLCLLHDAVDRLCNYRYVFEAVFPLKIKEPGLTQDVILARASEE